MHKPSVTLHRVQPRTLGIAKSLWNSLRAVLSDSVHREHEGVTFLLGLTDGYTSIAIACVQVRSRATWGSFYVDAGEMRRVIERAHLCGLQVVGQLHTHPGLAYHSEGDDEGAQIRFDGFVSIVVPDYGQDLPSINGVKSYMFSSAANQFVELDPGRVHLVDEVQ